MVLPSYLLHLIDLALLHLQTPFQESNTIKAIALNDRYRNLEGYTATLSGWGKTESSHGPSLLRQINLRVTKHGNDWRGMGIIQMAYTQYRGVCSGDSGGKSFTFSIRDDA